MAAAIWLFVRNPPRASAGDAPKGSVIPLLKIRNIRFSIALAALNMTSYASVLGFGPLYLVNVAGMSNVQMGTAITGISLVGIVCAFVGPMLSDRIGRKPVLIGSYAISSMGAIMMVLAGSSLPLVFTGALLAGAGGAGVGALIMAIIPGEAAPLHLKGTAMGFTAALGELLGAGLMPILVGAAADRVGLIILPWILLAVGVLFCLLTFALTESAPKVVERRAAATA
jgi:MFS family permease